MRFFSSGGNSALAPRARRHEEQGVIAEAAVPARFVEDTAAPDTFGNQRHRVVRMAKVNGDAAKACRPLIAAEIAHGLEELRVVRGIVAVLAGVARGVNAGSAAERGYFQAGVVGDRGEAGRLRRVACLQQRILDKREAGFLGALDAKIGLWAQGDAESVEQCLDLGEFAAIRRRDDDVGHLTSAASSAARCASTSSAMPASASASSASSSSRRKACPSAVPCTSM